MTPTRAEFTWTDEMPFGEFVTRFMETVLEQGESGRLTIDGTVLGKSVELSLSIELIAVKGKTS